MKAICGGLKEANSHLVDMAPKSVKQRLAAHYCLITHSELKRTVA